MSRSFLDFSPLCSSSFVSLLSLLILLSLLFSFSFSPFPLTILLQRFSPFSSFSLFFLFSLSSCAFYYFCCFSHFPLGFSCRSSSSLALVFLSLFFFLIPLTFLPLFSSDSTPCPFSRRAQPIYMCSPWTRLERAALREAVTLTSGGGATKTTRAGHPRMLRMLRDEVCPRSPGCLLVG